MIGFHPFIEIKFSSICFYIIFSRLQENPDLWKWLTGQEQPPEAIDTNPVSYTLPKTCFFSSLVER